LVPRCFAKLESTQMGDWRRDLSAIRGPAFIDVTQQSPRRNRFLCNQMLRGADYWRTVLDGAIGVDVYANNGVAVGDFDNDGSMISMFANRQDCPIGSTAIGAMARSKMQPRRPEWVSSTARPLLFSRTLGTVAWKTCSLFVELAPCSSEPGQWNLSP